MNVAYRQGGVNRRSRFKGRLAQTEQDGAVKGTLQPVILRSGAVGACLRRDLGPVENPRQIEAADLLPRQSPAHLQQVAAPYHLVEAAETEARHQFAHLSRDEGEIIHYMLRVPPKFHPQLRILGRHADGTGIEMAGAHHDAAEDHQGGRGESEFLGAEKGGENDVAPGLELAVRLHRDAVAQAVEEQGLVRFGQPQLPGESRMMNAGQRRGACPSFMPRDEDHVRLGFGHACGNGSDPHLGDQLDADAGLVIGVLQVVDQLGQILDGIDIVMGRR